MMDSTIIDRAYRLQKALASNHPFAPCIDNTAKVIIDLIISNNKAPKQETPVPGEAAHTSEALLRDLNSLIPDFYNAAAKAASSLDLDAIRALLQEQINKYRGETKTLDERVTPLEEKVRTVCEQLGATSEAQMENVRALIRDFESATRESILGLGVRVNALEAIGLIGLRKDMDEKLGSLQTALEHQNKSMTSEINTLRDELSSGYKNTLKEFGSQLNVNVTAIEEKLVSEASEVKAVNKTLSAQVKDLEAKCEVLTAKASYDDFEKLTSPAEKEQPAKPFEATDAAAVMEHLKQLEIKQNASITTHLELFMTSTQMQLDSMRADLDKLTKQNGVPVKEADEVPDDIKAQLDDIRTDIEDMYERLVTLENVSFFEVNGDTVRDEHIRTILNGEINRWLAQKRVLSEETCTKLITGIAIGIAQTEVESGLKYAIRSGRVMSRLMPPGPPLAPFGFPGLLTPPSNAVTNGVARGPARSTTSRQPSHKPAEVVSAVENGTPAAPAVYLPPHLTLGRAPINPTAPAFTPTSS